MVHPPTTSHPATSHLATSHPATSHPATTTSPSSFSHHSSSPPGQPERSGPAPAPQLSQLHQLQLLPSTSSQPGHTDSDSSPQVRLGPVAVLLKMNDMKIASSQSEGEAAEDRPPVEKKPSASRDPRKRPSSEEEDFRPAAKKILTGAGGEEGGKGAGTTFGKATELLRELREEDVRQVEEGGKGAGTMVGKVALDLLGEAREEARENREELMKNREELRENREVLREVREALVERTVSEGALREKYEDLVSKLQAKVRDRLES